MVSDVERNDTFCFRQIDGLRLTDGQGGFCPFVAELSVTGFLHGIIPVTFVELERDGSGQWCHRLILLIRKDFVGDFYFVFSSCLILAKAEELLAWQGDDGCMACDGASTRLVDGCIRNECDWRIRCAIHGVETVEGDGLFAIEIFVFADECFARQEGGVVADGVLVPMRGRLGQRCSHAERTLAVGDICSKVIFAVDFEIHSVRVKADDAIRRDGDFDAVGHVSGDAEVGFAPNNVFLRPNFDIIRARVGILRERQLVGDETEFICLQLDGSRFVAVGVVDSEHDWRVRDGREVASVFVVADEGGDDHGLPWACHAAFRVNKGGWAIIEMLPLIVEDRKIMGVVRHVKESEIIAFFRSHDVN